jgi:hypothetical protein
MLSSNMPLREPRPRPVPWPVYSQRSSHSVFLPFLRIEYVWSWTAYLLGQWAFLEVLEYLGRFSVLIAVIFYFSESGDRQKQKHYQAWQVINTAQGKGGSGGRLEALQELNLDAVPLVGVDVSGAFLMALHLDKAKLARANFDGVDARYSSFRNADLSYAGLRSANLRNSNFQKANLENAILKDADLNGASLTESNLAGADLSQTDLRGADLRGIRWQTIQGIRFADVYGVKNPPPGFADWALKNGAVSIASDEAWNAALPQP